jgi:hypothetical protein
MARLRARSTSPDPESRAAMLALRERKLSQNWAQSIADPSRPLLWAPEGMDGDERCLVVFRDGSVREARNCRPSWTRDRLDGETDWRFVDDDEPVPGDARFW